MPVKNATGTCLCGEVSYELTGNLGIFQYCHCSRCRKITGSAHAANILVAPDQFHWLAGEAQIGRYEVPQANHFATSFCKTCGSSLPWLTKSGKAYVVPAGTLDEHPGIEPMQNIFCASKAEWYVEASSLPQNDEFPKKK